MFREKERLLGVDISPSSVKLVELNLDSNRPQVEACAVETLPEGAMEDRHPKDISAVAEALKRAWRASGTRRKQAIIAVPTSSVITRTITLPVDYDEPTIEAVIETEAAQYIPYPLSEVYLDFEIRGASKTSHDTQDVMLVATRREYVDVRRDVLAEAGLKAAIVDVEAYAAENVFAELGRYLYFAGSEGADAAARLSELCTGMVDIGASHSTLYVFQGEELIFNREQTIGCDQLTQQIAEAYGLPRDRAELAKRSGELPEDYDTAVLEPFRNTLVEQISNVLQFFFSSSHFNSLDGLMLTGGGGLITGLNKILAERVGCPVTVANPFETMSYAKRIDANRLTRSAPLFTIACGLALRTLQ